MAAGEVEVAAAAPRLVDEDALVAAPAARASCANAAVMMTSDRQLPARASKASAAVRVRRGVVARASACACRTARRAGAGAGRIWSAGAGVGRARRTSRIGSLSANTSSAVDALRTAARTAASSSRCAGRPRRLRAAQAAQAGAEREQCTRTAERTAQRRCTPRMPSWPSYARTPRSPQRMLRRAQRRRAGRRQAEAAAQARRRVAQRRVGRPAGVSSSRAGILAVVLQAFDVDAHAVAGEQPFQVDDVDQAECAASTSVVAFMGSTGDSGTLTSYPAPS